MKGFKHLKELVECFQITADLPYFQVVVHAVGAIFKCKSDDVEMDEFVGTSFDDPLTAPWLVPSWKTW